MLGEKNSPTAEQSLIISSPLSPRLVIAGAGSGKTATMADRVVWLVANGWVRPEEVLGVTFTRKAAGELATRIRAKLAALQRIAAADTQHQVFPAGLLEHAMRSSRRFPRTTPTPAGSSPITACGSAWKGTWCCSAGPSPSSSRARWWKPTTATTSTSGPRKSTLVKAVIQLAGECSEHLQRPGRGPRLAAGAGRRVRGAALRCDRQEEPQPGRRRSSAGCCAPAPASRTW